MGSCGRSSHSLNVDLSSPQHPPRPPNSFGTVRFGVAIDCRTVSDACRVALYYIVLYCNEYPGSFWGEVVLISYLGLRTEAPSAVERPRNLSTQGKEVLRTFRDFRSGYAWGVIGVDNKLMVQGSGGIDQNNYLGEFYDARVI